MKRWLLTFVVAVVLVLGLGTAHAGPGGGGGVDPCHPPFTGLILC